MKFLSPRYDDEVHVMCCVEMRSLSSLEGEEEGRRGRGVEGESERDRGSERATGRCAVKGEVVISQHTAPLSSPPSPSLSISLALSLAGWEGAGAALSLNGGRLSHVTQPPVQKKKKNTHTASLGKWWQTRFRRDRGRSQHHMDH